MKKKFIILFFPSLFSLALSKNLKIEKKKIDVANIVEKTKNKYIEKIKKLIEELEKEKQELEKEKNLIELQKVKLQENYELALNRLKVKLSICEEELQKLKMKNEKKKEVKRANMKSEIIQYLKSLNANSIACDEQGKCVLVGSKIIKEGDYIKGFVVKKIEKDKIILENENQKIEISILELM